MNFQKLFLLALFSGLVFQANAQDKPGIIRDNVKGGVAVDSGPAMFSAYCAVCHGLAGKGNGPAAVALKKQPADLTQLSKKNGGTFPAARVSFTIEGREIMASHGSRDMPIWGNIFNLMDGEKIAKLRIHNLTAYVETLQEK